MNGMYEYWLASIPEISGRDKVKLIEQFGTEKELYDMSEYCLAEMHSIPETIRAALEKSRKLQNLEEDYESFRKQQVNLVCWRDEAYPKRLRNIYDMPYGLFVKGGFPPENQKNVAVVGARGCSLYGQSVAENIGKALAEHGVGVISGLAYGIDAAAHRGALAGNGVTYAVMGCGVDVCYPAANHKLYHRIPETGGIISEYHMGCAPQKFLFPLRNRIISALSDAVIVVEARRRSGSLITADCALEQNRMVYAVPGRISDSLSYGTNWLLAQGAAPFYSMEEFLKELGISGEKTEVHKKLIEFPLEKNGRLVYSVLDLNPKHLETIIEETGLNFAEVASALFDLQNRGYVKEIYKNHYIKSGL